MTETTTDQRSARDRLLAAADELFYDEGIHTVGIDRVIEHAGVAKATLYNAFGNKDGLIRAYLEGRRTAREDRIDAAIARHDDPRDRLLAVFDALGDTIGRPSFHGCAFVNASAESNPGSAAIEVSDAARAWSHALFAELSAAAGAADPDALGRRLMLLYDGALVSARMDRSADPAAAAKAAAAVLIDSATRR